jgi:hypothetical protein
MCIIQFQSRVTSFRAGVKLAYVQTFTGGTWLPTKSSDLSTLLALLCLRYSCGRGAFLDSSQDEQRFAVLAKQAFEWSKSEVETASVSCATCLRLGHTTFVLTVHETGQC